MDSFRSTFSIERAEPAIPSDSSLPTSTGKQFDPAPRESMQRIASASKPIANTTATPSTIPQSTSQSIPHNPPVAKVRPPVQLPMQSLSVQVLKKETSGASSQPTSAGLAGGLSQHSSGYSSGAGVPPAQEPTEEISAEGDDMSPVKPKDNPQGWVYTTPKNSAEYIAEVKAERERSWSS